MAPAIVPDAPAARRHLEAHGWIAKKAEAFRHLSPPPAQTWLGDAPAPAADPEDGWTLQLLEGTTAATVQARWLDAADPAERSELFGAQPIADGDDAAPFAWAHRALVRRGLRLRIAAGTSFVRLERRPVAAVEAPLLLLELAPGAACVLLEAHALDAADPLVQNLHVYLQLGQGARLQHLRHVSPGRTARVAHHVHAQLAEGAEYAQALLATGSDYHLQRSRVDLLGAGASSRVDGVALVAASTLEQQIVSHHAARDTRSGAEVLALASGAARVVANALTDMAAGCSDADARQKLVGIPTGGQPRIVLRPHLEIHHDQVQAAHGATWGALPEEALFFARQRGLDEGAAKALILEGLARAALARGVDGDALPEPLRLEAALAAAVARHLAAAPAKEASHG